MAETRRYWDGERWTDHIAPGATPVVVNSPGASGHLIAAWILAFVIPPLGLILGVTLPPQDQKHQGWVIAVSLVLTLGTVAWVWSAMGLS
jgi:positive regulator of sigma E activity